MAIPFQKPYQQSNFLRDESVLKYLALYVKVCKLQKVLRVLKVMIKNV